MVLLMFIYGQIAQVMGLRLVLLLLLSVSLVFGQKHQRVGSAGDTLYVGSAANPAKVYADGSNNVVIEDVVTGAKTLAQLAAVTSLDSSFVTVTADTFFVKDVAIVSEDGAVTDWISIYNPLSGKGIYLKAKDAGGVERYVLAVSGSGIDVAAGGVTKLYVRKDSTRVVGRLKADTLKYTVLEDNSGNISQWTNDLGYLTTYDSSFVVITADTFK